MAEASYAPRNRFGGCGLSFAFIEHMMRFILLLASFPSSVCLAQKASLTTCFAEVMILGHLDDLDKITKRLSPVYLVHAPVHRPEKDGKASVEFLVSVTMTSEVHARKYIQPNFINGILSVAVQGEIKAGSRPLGCKNEPLN